jgi:hypothetical protein
LQFASRERPEKGRKWAHTFNLGGLSSGGEEKRKKKTLTKRAVVACANDERLGSWDLGLGTWDLGLDWGVGALHQFPF